MSAWHAVLSEVRQQTALASGDISGANDSWQDLAEDATTTASQRQATLLWQQQQWHNAFEVLVRTSTVAAAGLHDMVHGLSSYLLCCCSFSRHQLLQHMSRMTSCFLCTLKSIRCYA